METQSEKMTCGHAKTFIGQMQFLFMKRTQVAFCLILLVSLSFADVGPGPTRPDITVRFVQNGEPFAGEMDAMFRCWHGNASGEGIMDQTDVDLVCENGICKPEGWFYKFNPCFYPEQGEVIFSPSEGVIKTTGGVVSFPEGKTYNVEIDVDSAETVTEESGPACPTALIMFSLLFLGIAGTRMR